MSEAIAADTASGDIESFRSTFRRWQELALSALVALGLFGIARAIGLDSDLWFLLVLMLMLTLMHGLFGERLIRHYEIRNGDIQVIGWLGRRRIPFTKVRSFERPGFSIGDLPLALLLVKPRSRVTAAQGSVWSNETMWPERPDAFVVAANAALSRWRADTGVAPPNT
jgi:hypothetical protein